MGKTDISWTDHVWNATRGCSRISPGCGGGTPDIEGTGGCYAERQAARFCGIGMPYEGLVRLGKNGPRWTGKVVLVPKMLDVPLRLKKPSRIFVNSMSDLFHEALSNEDIAAVFGVMAACPQHTFQILTKRAERMKEWFAWISCLELGGAGGDLEVRRCLASAYSNGICWTKHINYPKWPLPNVHLGVSVENQKYADERIPLLLGCPAAVHWISAEPLLGPIDVRRRMQLGTLCECREDLLPEERCDETVIRCRISNRRISWCVVGGESGPGARPFDVEWARSLLRQARSLPFLNPRVFVKQLGRRPLEDSRYLTLKDRAGADPSEWPEDLRVQEFPR